MPIVVVCFFNPKNKVLIQLCSNLLLAQDRRGKFIVFSFCQFFLCSPHWQSSITRISEIGLQVRNKTRKFDSEQFCGNLLKPIIYIWWFFKTNSFEIRRVWCIFLTKILYMIGIGFFLDCQMLKICEKKKEKKNAPLIKTRKWKNGGM